MTNNMNTFLEKAKDEYFRDDGFGSIMQPSYITEVVEDGENYVVFENCNGVLAVYMPDLFGHPELTDYIPVSFRES